MLLYRKFLYVDEFDDFGAQCTDLISGESVEVTMEDIESEWTAFSMYEPGLVVVERVILVHDSVLVGI